MNIVVFSLIGIRAQSRCSILLQIKNWLAFVVDSCHTKFLRLHAIDTKCIINPLKRSWWRHQMETFSALLAICAGNSPVPCEFSTQRPVTRSFDVYFDLRPNKRLSKQSWGWWFETLSCSLWRHRNDMANDGNIRHLSNVSRKIDKSYWEENAFI